MAIIRNGIIITSLLHVVLINQTFMAIIRNYIIIAINRYLFPTTWVHLQCGWTAGISVGCRSPGQNTQTGRRMDWTGVEKFWRRTLVEAHRSRACLGQVCGSGQGFRTPFQDRTHPSSVSHVMLHFLRRSLSAFVLMMKRNASSSKCSLLIFILLYVCVEKSEGGRKSKQRKIEKVGEISRQRKQIEKIGEK